MKRSIAFFLITSFVFFGMPQQAAIAQGSVYDYDPLDVPMLKQDEALCSNGSGTFGGKRLFFIGDSLTVGMARSGLLEKAASAGFEVDIAYSENPDNTLGFNSTTLKGRSIEATNGINIVSTTSRLATQEVQNANIFVIGLGTNLENINSGGGFLPGIADDLEGAPLIEAAANYMVKEINRINPNSPAIYWVNTYFTTSSSVGYTERNQALQAAADTSGFTVIDWAKEATQNPTQYPFAEDGTHHTTEGYANKSDFVLKSIGGNPGSALPPMGGQAGYDPISLGYPNFPDENAVISKLKEHITSAYSKSPFAKNLQYVDMIFSLSKTAGVNPLLVISIAQQENGYGGASSSATDNNNYFGITQGNGYRKFNSVEEGIDYFIQKISRHVTSPSGNYANVRNFYEYISVHQTGMIAYPGEYPPEAKGRDAVPPYLVGDPRMGGVLVSWDPTANANTPAPYTNKTYNPGIYYENSINLINKITGLNLSTSPSKNGSGNICGKTNPVTNAPGEKTYHVDGFTIYKQNDPVWAKNPYGAPRETGERTIASNGCGPSAMAMIITTLTGTAVTPAMVAEFGMKDESKTWSPTGGSDGVALATKAAVKWGLKATHLGANKNAINETLQSGGYVIVSGQGGLPFSQGGHFVVIRKLTSDNKWLVGDSSHESARPDTSTVPYDPDKMISEFTAGGYSSYAITL